MVVLVVVLRMNEAAHLTLTITFWGERVEGVAIGCIN